MTSAPKPLAFYHPAWWIATAFGIGKIPFMPGTFGSLFGIVLANILFLFSVKASNTYILLTYGFQGDIWWLIIGCMVFFCVTLFSIGCWASKRYAESLGKDDPQSVVIDEVVGQMIVCFLAIPAQFFVYFGTGWQQYGVLIALFGLFRAFDILKPWPINEIERRIKGGFGIMLDDLFAAFNAILIFYIVIMVGLDLHILHLIEWAPLSQ